jgi:2'-5' RNA ligase
MFVALDLPAQARAAIAAWRDELLAGRPGLRPVAPEALHVTLAFLGWQEESAADEIAAASFEAAAGTKAPLLLPVGVKAVPTRKPRLFALDLEDVGGRATRLQAAVAAALDVGGFYEPEKRPFWPHITLARVRDGSRELAPPDPCGDWRGGGVPGLSSLAPFTANSLTLYRSMLRPEGSLYEALGCLPLGHA